jgi:hypothetical protein
MIGVIADPAEHDVVREFFELFKTPWEFYRGNGRYEVALCSGDGPFDAGAKLVLVYAGKKTQFDDEQRIPVAHQRGNSCTLTYQADRIPIYGDTITFAEKEFRVLRDEDSDEYAAYAKQAGDRVLVRIGYDLFSEIRTLLTVGQSPANAGIPTLELHIALLRDLITGCGVPVIEIPPVPEGYRFIACLTHDVDHPSMRVHRWDHAMFGFLYRALFRSLYDFIHGHMSVRNVLANWAAACKLPFVHMGLAKDFWREFDDRYLELEKGLRSTFFVIPFKNYAGRGPSGQAPMLRASRYGARDITDTIRKLIAADCEVGLHGIDAWLDETEGSKEMEEIRRLTGAPEIGVRMHWLYYNEQSPAFLENVGAAYDSTIGYNETAGYRAGTTQAYKPLVARQLLELPMHVMDTALFYPDYLGLSQQDAKVLLGTMVDNAVRFGGCLTTNWHDRSIAPERLWGSCYRDLVQDLKGHGVWFATVGQAISWFRKRRSATFEMESTVSGAVRAKVAPEHGNNLPGLRLRTNTAQESGSIGTHRSEDYVDESLPTHVPSEARR